MPPQTDKATARPWKLAVGVIGPDKVWQEDSTGNEYMVARGIDNEHDAALIVKSVNEYEALCKVAECAKHCIAGDADEFDIAKLAIALDQLSTLRNGK